MVLRYSTSKHINPLDIDKLRDSIGWRKRGVKKWKEILRKSDFVYSVWEGKQLVGMGRILEDGVMCMFYDISVHKDHQGKKIGRKIMNELINHVKNKKYTSIGLFTESTGNYYKKYGFVESNGLELRKYMNLPKKSKSI